MKLKDMLFLHYNFHSKKSSAVCTFPNGYTASIITGECAHASEEAPYELAILLNGELCYTTGIMEEDVLGYLTEEEVDEYLLQIEALPTA